MSEFPSENNTSELDYKKEDVEQITPSSPEVPVVPVVQHEATGTQGTVVTVVLQWLTYAFLGWFAVALVWLASVVFDFMLGAGTDTGVSSYQTALLAFPLSATVALGIASIVTDVLYSRREPSVKEHAAKVIAIFHVVLFALVGTGFFVALIYNLVSQLLGLSATYGGASLSALIVSGVGVVLFAVLVGRVLIPARKKLLRVALWAILAVTSLGLIVGASIGPATSARRAAQDAVIETGLPSIAMAVNLYADKHDKLPATLNDIPVVVGSSDAKELIRTNAVRYTADTSAPKKTSVYSGDTKTTVYYYRLCATFKTNRTSGYTSYNVSATSPDTSYHNEGEQCYDLQTGYSAAYDVQGSTTDSSAVQ